MGGTEAESFTTIQVEMQKKHQGDRSTKTTKKRVQHGNTLVQTIKHDSNRAHRHMGTLNGTDMLYYAALTTETPPSALSSAHMSSYLKPTHVHVASSLLFTGRFR